MTIKRTINGEEITIELTEYELLCAYRVKRHRIAVEICECELVCRLEELEETDILDSISEEDRAELIHNMAERYEELTDYFDMSHDFAINSVVDDALEELKIEDI